MGKIGEIRPSDEIKGKGSRKFRPEAEIFGIFSIGVAPKQHQAKKHKAKQHQSKQHKAKQHQAK